MPLGVKPRTTAQGARKSAAIHIYDITDISVTAQAARTTAQAARESAAIHIYDITDISVT